MLNKPHTCVGCPLYEYPHGKKTGFSKPDGELRKGVLIVAEALGESEEEAGIGLVGKSGYFFFQNLSRIGIERDDFTIFNTVACRPPNNQLTKTSYEYDAIQHCSPNLDAVVSDCREKAKSQGQHFTILTLGVTAFKRIMSIGPKDPILKQNYLTYPFWSEKYQAFVIAAHHPAYIIRGYQHLLPILQYTAERAIEIAKDGLVFDRHQYLLDPEPATFESWVQNYFWAVDHNPDTCLSYDIETPYKQDKGEDELIKSEDEGTILRCSFSYKPNEAVSVPWSSAYLPALQELFAYDSQKLGWNSETFDSPKVKAQMPIGGTEIDGMLAWHVLNTSLPKALGFVSPFYAKTSQMWKHLSKDEPAFYNAKDSDMALRCWLGIREDLKRNNLWTVFNRHVVEVHRVFKFMSDKGILLDQPMRTEAETKLTAMIADIEANIERNIPDAARKIDKIFKREPYDKTGLLSRPGYRIEHYCTICGTGNPRKDHFKRFIKKVNPCADGIRGTRNVRVLEWYRLRSWRASKDQLGNYQKAVKHSAIYNRRKGKYTYDESAMMRLMAKYPNDKLYPLILEHREKQKLLSNYIGVTQLNGTIKGGMPTGIDGKVHCQFTSNPSTLRSACQNPNLQNQPRPSNELSSIIRNLITASPGCMLGAVDFSGIEAVLVGYDAAAPGYIRLARRDVHTFYCAYALHELEPGRILSNDLPLLSWDDEKLFGRLAELKSQLKKERNSLYKHIVHAGNFAQTAKGAKEKIYTETGVEHEINIVQKVMDIYFELFPEIKRWHYTVLSQAEKDGYLRNAFGYLCRFLHVFNYEKIDGKWDKRPNPDIGNKVIAFGPQSNAAGIIKEAMLRLYNEHFEEAGQYLRLLIHDELLSDVPEVQLDNVIKIMQDEMEKPIPEMRLPLSYNMGDCLSILTESKVGFRWGLMK